MKKAAIVKNINGNKVGLPDQTIGFFHDRSYSTHHYITVEGLRDFFNRWYEGDEGLKAFLTGEGNNYRMPNTSIVKFDYDPLTGEKIDWDLIAECYLSKYEHNTVLPSSTN